MMCQDGDDIYRSCRPNDDTRLKWCLRKRCYDAIRWKNSGHVDSASEDEVSESEETVEELLATGNDHDTSEDSEALATAQKNKESTYAPITNIPGIEGALFSVTQTYPLPSLPSTSLEDSTLPEQNGGSPSSHQSGSLVTGRFDGKRIPVQNSCELSVQVPCPGKTVKLFLFEKTHQERDEKWYILYMIPEEKYEVYASICASYKDEGTSQQGYITRQIPFAVENARSQEFFTLYVQEQVTVSFEIENQLQQNLVAQDARPEYVFRVPNICCESESRVAPGAKSHFRVEYVGGPGKTCQEHGKITLTVDSTMQYTLFFSIAFWVPD